MEKHVTSPTKRGIGDQVGPALICCRNSFSSCTGGKATSDDLHRKDWDGSSPQAGPGGSSPTVLPSRRGALLDVDRRSILDADQHRHYAHSPCHSECDAHCNLAPSCGTAELYRTQPLADPSHPSGPPGAVRQPNRAMNLCDRRDPASRSDKVHPSHQISWRKVAKANGPLRLVFWAAFSLTDRRSA